MSGLPHQEQRKFHPPILLRGFSAAERQVAENREIQFQEAFKITSKLIVSSSNKRKIEAMLGLVTEYSGQRLRHGDQVVSYRDPSPEHQSEVALEVAQEKAYRPRRNPQGLDFQIDHNVVSTGADINHWVGDQSALVQQHKLERFQAAFTPERQSRAVKKLIDRYSGQVRVRNVWDAGLHIKNGRDHQFGDKIEVITNPMDRELVTMFILAALENGTFYSTNTHLELLEMIAMHDQESTTSIAFLPRELERRGFTFAQLRQSATADLLAKAEHTIIRNLPVRYNV